VQASLAAFAESGYDLASTNRIVRDAGISKGALFKYFKDKEALFLYVVEVSTGSYLAGLPGVVGVTVFDWVRATTAHKLRYIKERPLAYRLWARTAKEPNHPVYAKAIRAQAEQLKRLGWDAPAWDSGGTLRPGVTPEHIANLLKWIGTGLQEKFAASMPELVDERFEEVYQSVVAELDAYLDILKSGLYREEPPS